MRTIDGTVANEVGRILLEGTRGLTKQFTATRDGYDGEPGSQCNLQKLHAKTIR